MSDKQTFDIEKIVFHILNLCGGIPNPIVRQHFGNTIVKSGKDNQSVRDTKQIDGINDEKQTVACSTFQQTTNLLLFLLTD